MLGEVFVLSQSEMSEINVTDNLGVSDPGNVVRIDLTRMDSDGERTKFLEAVCRRDSSIWILKDKNSSISLLAAPTGTVPAHINPGEMVGMVPPVLPSSLGAPSFLKDHGVKNAYIAGAMANGIASENLVISMGKAGYLSFFGAGGLHPGRVEEAIKKIQEEIGDCSYGFNLLHNPFEPSLEEATVALYLKYEVTRVSAAAYLGLTPYVVWYRLKGLHLDSDGQVVIKNHVFAKVSRSEVARAFMAPAPRSIVDALLQEGKISPLEAELSQRIPMASDITAEADSGGHTDQRPLVTMLPTFLSLRGEAMEKFSYSTPLRVGCGGGISTPQSVAAAFSMGADYVLTGSVNQMCLESGTSDSVKQLLAKMEPHDVIMAPAADMFEMGVKLQVLRKGTMFPMRAQKLYDLYQSYSSLDEIPESIRSHIEAQIFQKPLIEVWNETESFFQDRDPSQLIKARKDPKHKMALVFRWYLGKSSLWAISGDPARRMDYQIWAGPATGAFNQWVKGSYLEAHDRRSAVDVAFQLMDGAARLLRLIQIKHCGVPVPETLFEVHPHVSEVM